MKIVQMISAKNNPSLRYGLVALDSNRNIRTPTTLIMEGDDITPQNCNEVIDNIIRERYPNPNPNPD